MKGLVILLLSPFCVSAQLQLAKIFTDNMVLQRDKPIRVWGKASPGKTVSISLGKEKRSAKAKTDSSWNLSLPSLHADSIPQAMTVTCGGERISLKNILIGDLWVCIGQSNMEWPMIREMHFKDEFGHSDQPLIRFYNPGYAGKNIFGVAFTDSVVHRLNTERFYEGEWQNSDSNSIKTMSAVAYFFGKNIVSKTHVPVGLINLSIGGAPLEAFIDTQTLKSSKQFSSKVKGDWLNNDELPVWARERGRQNVGAIPNVPADENGKNHGYKPGFAYKSGIEPLLQMPVKGILCYQGESNAQEKDRVNEYGSLTKLLIDDYRAKWHEPRLPFYFVQLSSIDTVKYKGHLWPAFRNEQRKILALAANTGMAVCSDIGAKDDVHPTNKKDVGERLAKWALYQVYHQEVTPSGPLALKAKYENGKIEITFRYGNGLATSDNKPLRGFSTTGIGDIDALIKDEKVILRAAERPAFIYYGWKPFSDANLVNSEKLPASTFKIKVE